MDYDKKAYHLKKIEERNAKKARDEQREFERSYRPCFDLFDYSRGIRLNAMHLKWHIKTKFCKRTPQEKRAMLREFSAADAGFLQVNNPEACIRYYPIFAREMNRFAGTQNCHFVTFAPRRFAMPIADARSFNIQKLLSWARQVLLGLEYVGHIDIACYSNFSRDGVPGPILSFHVHVVVRGASRAHLDALADRVNKKEEAFIPKLRAADVEDVTPGTIHRLAAYMCKGATGDYRISADDDEVADKDGVLNMTLVRFKQYKASYATPGLQLKVRDVTRRFYHDDFTFAGGAAGRQALERIRYEARQSMPHSMRSGRQVMHSGKLLKCGERSRSFYTRDFSYRVQNDPLRCELKRPWRLPW